MIKFQVVILQKRSPIKSEFKVDNVLFTFNSRTLLFQTFLQVINLDKQSIIVRFNYFWQLLKNYIKKIHSHQTKCPRTKGAFVFDCVWLLKQRTCVQYSDNALLFEEHVVQNTISSLAATDIANNRIFTFSLTFCHLTNWCYSLFVNPIEF